MTPAEKLALLRRFEPAVQYTLGELFLPMAVEDYLAGSALVEGAGDRRTVLVERGRLTLRSLCDVARDTPTAKLSIEHVGDPLDRRAFLRTGCVTPASPPANRLVRPARPRRDRRAEPTSRQPG